MSPRVPDPEPPEDGVVIEVRANGICRSDWHAWQGHDPTIKLPHVPGHELAGVVVAAGPRVANWRGGERVTVPFCGGCGVWRAMSGGEPAHLRQRLSTRFYRLGLFCAVRRHPQGGH